MIDLSLFDRARLDAALEALLATQDSSLHAYTPAPGLPALRKALSERLTACGYPVALEGIYIPCGAQAGRAILARALLDPGDEVLFLTPPAPGFPDAVSAAGASVSDCLTEQTRLLVLSGASVPDGAAKEIIAAGAHACLMADCVSRGSDAAALALAEDACILNGDFGPALSGECIGYLAVGSRFPDADRLIAAIAGAGRACGYVNPPSLMQRALLALLT